MTVGKSSMVLPQEVWLHAEIDRPAQRFAVNRLIHRLVFLAISEILGRSKAKKMHTVRSKPFAASPPIVAAAGGDNACLFRVPAGEFKVRLGFATPLMAAAFAAYANGVSGAVFPVANTGAAVKVAGAEIGRRWRAAQFGGNSPAAVRVRLVSPVVFKGGAETYVSLSAGSIVNSLARKARMLGLPVEAERAERLARHVSVPRAAVKTVPYRLWEDWTAWGAVGELEMVLKAASPEERSAFAVLLGLAEFLGLGAKTAFGAGYVRLGA
ncbi:MAG: CRISPR system precrRNA processing endoribonuclease RAMP protein Cas6 [Moorellales bacterium]